MSKIVEGILGKLGYEKVQESDPRSYGTREDLHNLQHEHDSHIYTLHKDVLGSKEGRVKMGHVDTSKGAGHYTSHDENGKQIGDNHHDIRSGLDNIAKHHIKAGNAKKYALSDHMKFGKLEELSKATLGSYIKKATVKIGVHTQKSAEHDSKVVAGKPSAAFHGERAFKHSKIANKRAAGIGKAVDRLTKESVNESVGEGDTVKINKSGSSMHGLKGKVIWSNADGSQHEVHLGKTADGKGNIHSFSGSELMKESTVSNEAHFAPVVKKKRVAPPTNLSGLMAARKIKEAYDHTQEGSHVIPIIYHLKNGDKTLHQGDYRINKKGTTAQQAVKMAHDHLAKNHPSVELHNKNPVVGDSWHTQSSGMSTPAIAHHKVTVYATRPGESHERHNEVRIKDAKSKDDAVSQAKKQMEAKGHKIGQTFYSGTGH